MREETEIIFPAAFVEAFADGVGNVAGRCRARGKCGAIVGAGENQGANDFAGGVEEEGMPEIAGNGFFALAAFAEDGFLHGVGDAVRSFVEENFEGFGTLIARISAGDGDAERVEGGVGAGRAGVGGDIHADALLGPVGLIDFGEAMRKVEAIAADERSDGGNPAAVGAIVVFPEAGAIDGSRGVESFGKFCGKAGIAGFFLEAGEVFAGFKIAELIFDEDHFEADGEVLVGVGFGIEGDGGGPDALFGGREIGNARGVCRGGICGGVCRALQAGDAVERVVEIQPKAAVKFVDGKRSGGGFFLSSGKRREKKRKQAYEEAESAANGSTQWAHEKNTDGSAKWMGRQTLPGPEGRSTEGKQGSALYSLSFLFRVCGERVTVRRPASDRGQQVERE